MPLYRGTRYPLLTAGSLGGFSAEAQALFAAMEVQPSDARKRVIDTFIRALMAGGVWDKLDVLYVFAAHTEQAALLNWVAPGTFDGQNVSATAFAEDEGFTSDGSADYIDSGFNGSTAGGHYSLNSAAMGAWALADPDPDGYQGYCGANNNTTKIIRNNTDRNMLYANHVQADIRVDVNPVGFHVASRTGATTFSAYRNGVSVGTNSTAADAIPNANIDFLRAEGSLYSTGPFSLGFIGGGLSGTEVADFYAAALAYMQAVGAVA